jgi:hypothetical protein
MKVCTPRSRAEPGSCIEFEFYLKRPNSIQLPPLELRQQGLQPGGMPLPRDGSFVEISVI